VAWLGAFAFLLLKHWPTETLKHLFALSRRSRTCAQAGSEGTGKILEGGGLEGGFAQAAQSGFVLNGFDGVAKSYGDWSEADLQDLKDALVETFLQAFLAAFLAELLSDSHGCGADFRLGDRKDLTLKGVFVNASFENVTDRVRGRMGGRQGKS
jgi:hypothetical protein